MCDVKLVCLKSFICLYLVIYRKKSLKIAVGIGQPFPNYAFQDSIEIVLFSRNQVAAKLISA